jgi:hypothetical protein
MTLSNFQFAVLMNCVPGVLPAVSSRTTVILTTTCSPAGMRGIGS